MRFIEHTYLHGTSGSSIPCTGAARTRTSSPSFAFAFAYAYATASAAAATVTTSTSTAATNVSADSDSAISIATTVTTSPTNHLFQCCWNEMSHVCPTLQIKKYGINGKCHRCPRHLHVLQGSCHHASFQLERTSTQHDKQHYHSKVRGCYHTLHLSVELLQSLNEKE